MEEKGWQKNRLCLKHHKNLHLKPKLEFRNQNILCVSLNFHLKTAVPTVSTGYSGVSNPLLKLTAFSIKEESQEHKNPGLSPILFFSLNGQQSKENVYRTKITKKKHSNGTEDGGSYIRISQSPRRAQSLSVSSSSPFGWGCWLPLSNLLRTHKTCANSSQS